MHVCVGYACVCKGNATHARQILKQAIRTLLMRHPGHPSLSRWTTMQPAMAYAALWVLIGTIAPASLRLVIKSSKLPEIDQSNALEILSSEGYQLAEGVRIKSCYDFVSLPHTLLRCIVGVITNSEIHHMLCLVLDWESESHSNMDVARLTKRKKRQSSRQSGADERNTFVASRMSLGAAARDCIRNSTKLLCSDICADVPTHIRGFRTLC